MKSHSVLLVEGCQVSQAIMDYIDRYRDQYTGERISQMIETNLLVTVHSKVVNSYLRRKVVICKVCEAGFHGTSSRSTCSIACRNTIFAARVTTRKPRGKNRNVQAAVRRGNGMIPAPSFKGRCKSIPQEYKQAAQGWLYQ